jgi:hypothetical protein
MVKMKLLTYFSVTVVCRHQDQYLLLKISPHHKYCPGDWDFLATRIETSRKSAEEIAYAYTRKHTGLMGKIVKKGPPFEFRDRESRATWVIYPFVLMVLSKKVELSKKYDDYKWVKSKNISRYDRLSYLKAYIKAMHLLSM